MIHPRREPPKIIDIQDMVRLSGKSILYLPQDYAPCCLILPTCIRATAQHLAQNVTTRGIFRIPGSVRIVGALFNHYCYTDNGGDDIASTVRCVNLPLHIPFSVHDVASTFKRLLSVLPGGILGSLALFDALVAIHSHLNGEPEFPRTKQTKIRARLIALAIGTIKSQFRRELICAVFGLLSLIGRVAEVTPREDEDGRPLPTADLMGYSALGIVFGPLLIGDLLDQYSMKLATPSSGMLLFPLSPKGLRRDRRRAKAEGNQSDPPTVNRILVANSIAEMLIANWRDIVRQMKCLGTHRRKDVSSVNLRTNSLRPSASDFAIKMPRDMDTTKGKWKGDGTDPDRSPEPDTPTMGLKRRRSKSLKNAASNRLLPKMSMGALSPTREESLADGESTRDRHPAGQDQELPSIDSKLQSPKQGETGATSEKAKVSKPQSREAASVEQGIEPAAVDNVERQQLSQLLADETTLHPSQVYMDSVPPRVSSRSRHEHDSSETTQTVMSLTAGDMIELSPIPVKGRLSTVSGRRRRGRASNNPSSFDGSEDSPAPLSLSHHVHAAYPPGTLGPEGRGSRLRFSPRRQSQNQVAVPDVKLGINPLESSSATQRTEENVKGENLDARQARRRSKTTAASQRSTQNSLEDGTHPKTLTREDGPVTEPIPRGSIDRTPEHFYPAIGVRQHHHHHHGGSRGAASSPSGGEP